MKYLQFQTPIRIIMNKFFAEKPQLMLTAQARRAIMHSIKQANRLRKEE